MTKIRKQWLISFFCVGLMMTSCDYLYLSLFKGINFKACVNQPADRVEYIIGYIIGYCVLFRIIFGLIAYYCSYVKKGSKWLLLILIVLPIRILMSFQSLRQVTTVHSGLLWLLIKFIVPVCLFIWFGKCCYQLRKENLKYQNNPERSETPIF